MGWLEDVGIGYSVKLPEVDTRPILSAELLDSVYQSAPSDPVAIPKGRLEDVGIGYSVTEPDA